MKTKVGYSQNTDAFQSGFESAQMADLKNCKVGF